MTHLQYWRRVLHGLQASYALLDAHDQISESDSLFAEWLGVEPATIVGSHLTDLIPEFFGQEDGISAVRAGQQPSLRLEHINRPTPEGRMRYLSFTLLPGSGELGTALLLVQDMTDQGQTLQTLTQHRNELRLLRRKLDEANQQLDFLLHLYLPPEVADQLLRGELRPELGGDLREVTVLFADMRGFTAVSEHLTPDQTMALLNAYLSVVVDALTKGGGTINQFQGDNVMAIFGAPIPQPDHALRAVQAAVDAQHALRLFRASQVANLPPLSFGIGINSGMALVGNSGGYRRYTYTAIGDTVNLASRITAVATADDIWLSDAVHQRLNNQLPIEPLEPRTFKGKTQPTPLFRVAKSAEPST